MAKDSTQFSMKHVQGMLTELKCCNEELRKSDERRRLISLADALIEDLMATSDEDILNEAIKNGADVSAICNDMRARFINTLQAHINCRSTMEP